MKVLDLQCDTHHRFEGWFTSEDDFVQQMERSLVACPMCGSTAIGKLLSAPRLCLGTRRNETAPNQEVVSLPPSDGNLQAAWMALVKRVIENTEDVGQGFAEEARKIHYGEKKVRGIRGSASIADTRALLEEGIEVMPFPVPEATKGTIQ